MNKQSNKPYTKDPYYKRWMIGLSERTKQNYTDRIPNWITFTNMNLTQQVTKRMNDLTAQDLSERQFFEDKFRAYKEYLEKRGDLKPLSVRTELTAVASFFSRIGLPLALKRGDWESTQQQPIIQRIKLTRDDVKAMYAHANLRDRALLLVLAQSGFSEVDVSFFRVEELKGLLENPETEHYFIEKPREKTNEIKARRWRARRRRKRQRTRTMHSLSAFFSDSSLPQTPAPQLKRGAYKQPTPQAVEYTTLKGSPPHA